MKFCIIAFILLLAVNANDIKCENCTAQNNNMQNSIF